MVVGLAREYRFTIPGRPRAWKRPAQRRGGGRYDDPKQVARKKHIAEIALVERPDRWVLGLPVELGLGFYFRHPKAAPKVERPYASVPDLDNLEKLIKDALNGIAWLDDSLVCRVVKFKTYGQHDATRVSIKHLSPEEWLPTW